MTAVFLAALTFVVPMPLNLANSRIHWRKKNAERRVYFAVLDQLQGAGYLPPPPKKPFAKATIAVRMTVARRMDQDNSVSRCKWPCDWLQSRGYIENDRDLEWLGMPEQTIAKGGVAAMIHIDLTEA